GNAVARQLRQAVINQVAMWVNDNHRPTQEHVGLDHALEQAALADTGLPEHIGAHIASGVWQEEHVFAVGMVAKRDVLSHQLVPLSLAHLFVDPGLAEKPHGDHLAIRAAPARRSAASWGSMAQPEQAQGTR